MPFDALKLLLTALDDAWEKSVWTEPLRRALEGVSPEEANWHPAEGIHSITEIVNHVAYWKQYCARMLTTQHVEDLLPRPSDGEAPRGVPDWPQAVENLRRQHQALRAAVAALQPEQLTERFPLTNMAMERVLLGLAAHDAHHAGQILLLRRLVEMTVGPTPNPAMSRGALLCSWLSWNRSIIVRAKNSGTFPSILLPQDSWY